MKHFLAGGCYRLRLRVVEGRGMVALSFFFVFASFLKFGPIFFGMEAKNGEDALQARRHGLMKEGRKDGDWSDRPCS